MPHGTTGAVAMGWFTYKSSGPPLDGGTGLGPNVGIVVNINAQGQSQQITGFVVSGPYSACKQHDDASWGPRGLGPGSASDGGYCKNPWEEWVRQRGHRHRHGGQRRGGASAELGTAPNAATRYWTGKGIHRQRGSKPSAVPCPARRPKSLWQHQWRQRLPAPCPIPVLGWTSLALLPNPIKVDDPEIYLHMAAGKSDAHHYDTWFCTGWCR